MEGMGALGAVVLICFSYFFFLLMATPVVYGSSQARGQLRTADASLCHSHSNTRFKLDPRLIFDLHHSLQLRWILNPLSKTRDGTRILMDMTSGS